MSDLARQFVRWLQIQTDEAGRGRCAAIARETGLDPSYVSRLLSGQRQGIVDLVVLERIASAKRCDAWEVLWMVEHLVPDPPPRPRSPRR